MKKQKKNNQNVRRARARAKCASFDIDIVAEFKPHGLASGEVHDVQRKLKNALAETISKLPFAHVYPCEVRVR